MRLLPVFALLALSACAPAPQRTIEAVRAEYRQREIAAERAAPFVPAPYSAAMISQALARRNAGGFVSHLIARRNGPTDADFDFCGDVTQLVGGTRITRRFFGSERAGVISIVLDDASVAPCAQRVVKSA